MANEYAKAEHKKIILETFTKSILKLNAFVRTIKLMIDKETHYNGARNIIDEKRSHVVTEK